MKIETPTKREQLLKEAVDATIRARNNTYGPPAQDFQRTADMMNAMGFSFCMNEDNGEGGLVHPIAPHHVAMIMVALKLSRLVWSPEWFDSWLDVAGYAACGWEAFNEG